MAERYILQQVNEEVNRKCRPRNTTTLLSTPYIDPERHNTLVTDSQTERETDDIITPIADHRSYCVQRYDRLKHVQVHVSYTEWSKKRYPGFNFAITSVN